MNYNEMETNLSSSGSEPKSDESNNKLTGKVDAICLATSLPVFLLPSGSLCYVEKILYPKGNLGIFSLVNFQINFK